MDGTTPVLSAASETCIFVNRATVLSSGSGLVNAGNITITNQSSGDTLAYIPLGVSVTQQAAFYVPSDERCYINDLYVSADKLSGSDPRVEFLVKVYNSLTTETEYTIRRELLDTANESRARFPNFKDQALLAGEIITIEANSDTANTEVSATIDLTCRKI